MIVLDTSALLFWTIRQDKLTTKARDTITNANRIIISSISIWEIGIKVQKNRLTLSHPLNLFVDKLTHIPKVEILSVTTEMWLANVNLAWQHKDPTDRTIVATAQLLDCPLITSDRAIRAFYPKAIWK